MSSLPDRLPGRVDEPRRNHLRNGAAHRTNGADSYTLADTSSTAPTRVGRLAIDRLRSLLSDRELDVLGSVDRFRYLTAGQIQALHFHNHRTELTATRICRRVLEKLTAARLLTRLDRRIGGVRAGSSSYVYGLAETGHRLMHQDDGSRKRWREPSRQFLDHTLAVADVAIAVTVEARSGSFELLNLEVEPQAWRSFQRGLAGTEILKPDLFIAVGIGDYEDRWFLEVDLGTESVPVVLRKCTTYSDYYHSGQEQARAGVFPRVLWITRTAKRVTKLRSAIARTGALHQELFDVGLLGDAVSALKGGAT